MATTRYVNTNNSVSGDGTTNQTDGSADSAFVSLSAAMADVPATLTEEWTIICDGTAADTTAVATTGHTTSGSGHLIIQAASYPAEWDTNKYRLAFTPADAGAQLNIATAMKLTLRGLQFGFTTAGDYVWRKAIDWNSGGTEVTIDACLFRIDISAGGSGIYTIAINATPWTACSATNIRNCGIWFVGSAAGTAEGIEEHTAAGDTFNVYNCTIKNAAVGLKQAAATVTATNVGYVACTTATSGTVGGSTCSSSTPTFASGKEFELDTTDTTWKDQGTDLSGTFTGDITAASGRRSGTFDIGAYELQTATGQFARPAADRTDGNWLNSAGTPDNVNLYSYIDEASASDADYIRSGATPSADTCTIDLSSIATPQAGTVTLRVRARYV